MILFILASPLFGLCLPLRPMTLESECEKLHSSYNSFCSRSSNDNPSDVTQGRPGKRRVQGEKGEPGIPGRRGEQGPIGMVDYQRVEEMIAQRVEEGFCPVQYNGKCFWAEVRYGGISCAQGSEICQSFDAEPANVYSKEHYRRLMNYLRTLIAPGTAHNAMYVWLGMQFNLNGNVVTLSNGTRARYVKWYQAYPQKECCCMGITSRIPWDARNQGMYNQIRGHLIGVLCETD